MRKRIPISDLRSHLAEELERLRQPDGWFIVTRRGRDAAAVVSLNLLRRLLEGDLSRSPETKAAHSADPDDLLRKIEAVRRVAGLPPFDVRRR